MRPRVLVGVCGGIAAYKAAEVVRRLGERGFELRCAMTRSARAFLQPLTLEVLTGHAVYEEEYLSATGRGEESHIAVADWADAVCVVPATAHFLARLALGLADDFLTTTALAFSGPVVVAPAMHTEMWRKEATAEHVETLTRRGVIFAGPVEGPARVRRVGGRAAGRAFGHRGGGGEQPGGGSDPRRANGSRQRRTDPGAARSGPFPGQPVERQDGLRPGR